MSQLASGCQMSFEEWLNLNRNQVFTNPDLKKYVSPFPPVELMANVSGLQNEQDFAAHGTDIYRALTLASSKPLSDFTSILDFGCGCGRLARMFKGHSGRIAGCDIDARHVDWINKNLDFMEVKLSNVNPPIPYKDNEFEAIISISIFTHLTEKSQDQFLSELHRVCSPEGRLFLTVHGMRALERAVNEPTIRAMLNMDEQRFEQARQAFADNRHAFILQFGHLTTIQENTCESERISENLSGIKKMVEEPFEYGITFVPEDYLRSHWGKWFDIVGYHHGGIHGFQDIVVLKPKK